MASISVLEWFVVEPAVVPEWFGVTTDTLYEAYSNPNTVLAGFTAKGDKGDQGIKGDKGDQGDQGLKGDKGDQGDQGIKGDKGDTGDQGLKGDTGTLVRYGTTAPAGALGLVGDLYVRSTGELYEKTASTTWTLRTNLTGPQGLKGDQGDQGLQGLQGVKGDTGTLVRYGTTVPAAGLGNNGDLYVHANGNLYEKVSGAWVFRVSIKGPQGDQGLQGLKGDQGDQGIKGDKGDQGDEGLSAYEVAVLGGFSGNEAAWLASLVGPQGLKGDKGEDAVPAPSFESLLSADVAISTSNSFATGPSVTVPAGTWLILGQAQFVRNANTASQVTARLRSGGTVISTQQMYHAALSGITLAFSLADIVTVASTTTFDLQMATTVGATTALMKAAVTNNAGGNNATRIVAVSLTGPDGKSAYELAVEGGFAGNQAAWLASLVGPQGEPGEVSLAQLNTALALKANLASPALTGTPTAPTASAGTNTTQLATTAFVTAAANLKANLASPALTGTPTAPTAANGTNTTQLATTAFVQSAVAGRALATHTHDIADITGLSAALAAKADLDSPNFTGTPTAVTAAPGTNTAQLATTEFVANALSGFSSNSYEFVLEQIEGGDIINAVAGKEYLFELAPNAFQLPLLNRNGPLVRFKFSNLSTSASVDIYANESDDDFEFNGRTAFSLCPLQSCIVFSSPASTGWQVETIELRPKGNRVLTSRVLIQAIHDGSHLLAADANVFMDTSCLYDGFSVTVQNTTENEIVLHSPGFPTVFDIPNRGVLAIAPLKTVHVRYSAQTGGFVTDYDNVSGGGISGSATGNVYFYDGHDLILNNADPSNRSQIIVRQSSEAESLWIFANEDVTPGRGVVASIDENGNPINSLSFGRVTAGDVTLNGNQILTTANGAPKSSPTFTGTVVLPSTTSIGSVTSAELSRLAGVAGPIQSQLDSKIQSDSGVQRATIEATATRTLPTGRLWCNGALISRSTYSALFNALVRRTTNTQFTVGTPGIVNWTGHGLQVNDPVVFESSGTLPTGVVAGTTYYVSSANYAANTFSISATPGGAAIAMSGSPTTAHTAESAPWGRGDGSTTFALPDLRGEFLRGWDNGRGVDSGRVFGAVQESQNLSHTHIITMLRTTKSGTATPTVWSWNENQNGTDSIASSASGGSEARPRNVPVNYMIKF